MHTRSPLQSITQPITTLILIACIQNTLSHSFTSTHLLTIHSLIAINKAQPTFMASPTRQPTLPTLSPTPFPTPVPTAPLCCNCTIITPGIQGCPADPTRDCQAEICPIDPLCCNVEWDAVCANAADALCHPATNPPTLAPTTTLPLCCACTVPHSSPGCAADFDCQRVVCNTDVFCCNSQWDDTCAEEAALICVNGTPSPTQMPTNTSNPTIDPTKQPSFSPTDNPTKSPTINPSLSPSMNPTIEPTNNPTQSPTNEPTVSPSKAPTFNPTNSPTINPTMQPSKSPTFDPTVLPTVNPTIEPTKLPSFDPTISPSVNPTNAPTISPTQSPTHAPTPCPTRAPIPANDTLSPTPNPIRIPTPNPTPMPTNRPSLFPTLFPTSDPTKSPTSEPTISPTVSHPTYEPTKVPTINPTAQPSPAHNGTYTPTALPISFSTKQPTLEPTLFPTNAPTNPPLNTTVWPSISPTWQTSIPTPDPMACPECYNYWAKLINIEQENEDMHTHDCSTQYSDSSSSSGDRHMFYKHWRNRKGKRKRGRHRRRRLQNDKGLIDNEHNYDKCTVNNGWGQHRRRRLSENCNNFHKPKDRWPHWRNTHDSEEVLTEICLTYTINEYYENCDGLNSLFLPLCNNSDTKYEMSEVSPNDLTEIITNVYPKSVRAKGVQMFDSLGIQIDFEDTFVDTFKVCLKNISVDDNYVMHNFDKIQIANWVIFGMKKEVFEGCTNNDGLPCFDFVFSDKCGTECECESGLVQIGLKYIGNMAAKYIILFYESEDLCVFENVKTGNEFECSVEWTEFEMFLLDTPFVIVYDNGLECNGVINVECEQGRFMNVVNGNGLCANMLEVRGYEDGNGNVCDNMIIMEDSTFSEALNLNFDTDTNRKKGISIIIIVLVTFIGILFCYLRYYMKALCNYHKSN